MNLRRGSARLMGVLAMTCGCLLNALAKGEHPAKAESAKPIVFTDYGEAYQAAQSNRRMLLIYFQGPRTGGDLWETQVFQTPSVQHAMRDFVVAKLPVSATGVVGGKTIHLLHHPAFAEMHRLPGVAIIDLANVDSAYYGRVVSVFPFKPGRHLSQHHLTEMLQLPPGSLTQRTLIFAVRVHPEAPASADSRLSAVLASESESHARHQAALGVQGHHNWDHRFQRINGRLSHGLLAQEVCAESWPGQDLIDAAFECVDSWRQSPGHWSAVRGRNALFGFDMKRGRNGVWYGTGIFARH